MVNDVLELMGQTEALAGLGFSAVDGDEPFTFRKVRSTRRWKWRVAPDLEARQVRDHAFGNSRVGDLGEFQEPVGLQLGVAQGLFIKEWSLRHEVTQDRNVVLAHENSFGGGSSLD